MNIEKINDFDKFLKKLSESLDISDNLLQKVLDRYKSIGTWLNRNESKLSNLSPEIYPQGSIRLGTVVKPINEEDSYDVDLVCELNVRKEKYTQKQIKELVGGEIKAYAKSNGMKSPAEEKHRCWALNYSEEVNFHADITPAIPDGNSFNLNLIKNNLANEWALEAVSITDDTHQNYEMLSLDWPVSNPKGFYLWFKQRMKTQYEFALKEMEKRGTVEKIDISEYRIKTPLQRAIQILKRHRDIMFAGDGEHKPISIIITTLAAQAYNNEASLPEAIQNILYKMQNYIYEKNGECWIPNPTNPLENFADKWNKNPIKKEKFMTWLYQAKNDFEIAFNAKDLLTFSESLRSFIGDKAIDNISTSFKLTLQESSKSIQLGDYSHALLPKWQMDIKRYVEVACFATMITKTPTSNQVKRLPVVSGMPIGKGLSLNFEVKGIKISEAHEIYWQVVNTGEEARKANGLRGDFYRGYNNGINRNESTLYKGVHWVQCFVINSGKCIAVSDKFIIKIV